MADDIYINPQIYVVLAPLSLSPDFPTESEMIELYTKIKMLSSDDIVSIAVTDPRFSSYLDIIKSSISGMDIRGVGTVVTKFLDKHYPSLIERINTNDVEFELYKDVLTKLMDEIRKDDLDGDVQG